MHATQHASFPSVYGIIPSNQSYLYSSYKFLLDEECPQMCQLPRASDTKNNKLDQSPSDNTGVCMFGLVPELGLTLLRVVSILFFYSHATVQLETTHPLKDLLSPNVLQPRVQVLDLFYQRLDMSLVCALNPTCLSDRHI